MLNVLTSSFRDPSGFVFTRDGKLFRAVTAAGQGSYRALMDSGLYATLTERSLLVPHRETDPPDASIPLALEPVRLPFISYPYEWSFSQLRDAALLTLEIQTIAVEKGVSLKDATPYNVQFFEGRPIFIDTLSFEPYRERPWVAYRQFCEMFLAPLAMMATREADYNRYLLADLGGMRLATVSRLLPRSTWMNFGWLAHIHLHAMGQKKHEGSTGPTAEFKMPKIQHLALLDQLQSLVSKLRPFRSRASFGAYYAECSHYTSAAEEFKAKAIEEWVRGNNYRTAADLGANDGKYSRLLTRAGILTLALDSNASCVDGNYLRSLKENDGKMMPLVSDLSNLSGGAGWNAREREPLFNSRFKPELVMALAIIHHLRISAGVSMQFLAQFFSDAAQGDLILEFVPKSDPMVRHLLRAREDIFGDYDETSFEAAFGRFFAVKKKTSIPETHRTLYFLQKK